MDDGRVSARAMMMILSKAVSHLCFLLIAVVLAHQYLQRRATARERELPSELPWLVVMVGYTMLSLWLLAQPLMEQLSPPGQS